MSDCVEFDGYRTPKDGYGWVNREGKRWLAHRWAWTQAHGPIPDGMLVCHHCDNPPCINVEHLFLGTYLDNNRDKSDKGRYRNGMMLKTHCKYGHPFDGDNTVHTPQGHRACRACRRRRTEQATTKRRAAIANG